MSLVQENTQPPPPEKREERDSIPLAMTEYTALRDEILKRIELMNQVASLGFLVPFTIFAFGFQTRDATILLLYPLVALVWAVLWSQHERRARECGYYIRAHIETQFANAMHWEHFMDATRTRHRLFDRDSDWAAIGIFSGTGILALVVGIPVAMQSGTIVPFWFLLATAMLAIVLTTARLFIPYGHRQRIQEFSPSSHETVS